MDMPIPSQTVLAQKARVVARLQKVLPQDSVIHDPMETRAYECDALTAYRCPPMAAVLPSTTQEVSDVLRICHEEGVPVVPRGSGTSLAGGALPTADCVILGVARMNDVLETNYPDRYVRVQSGRTNLSVTGAVEEDGFFYAPDPSSQLACAIAGNIAMNSGGAHCLKYGVTTNNLMGVTMVLMDGTVVDIGGAHLDAGGLDLLGLVCGSEGQLGVVTEATLRILHKPEGARPVLVAFNDNEVAGACVSDIIKAGVLPVAIEFMDRLCIETSENFAKAGYPDCNALLIIEVEGSEQEIDDQLALHRRDRQPSRPCRGPREQIPRRKRQDLVGPQVRLWRHWPDQRLHVSGRHDPCVLSSDGFAPHWRVVRAVRPESRQRVSRRGWQHAPPDPV